MCNSCYSCVSVVSNVFVCVGGCILCKLYASCSTKPKNGYPLHIEHKLYNTHIELPMLGVAIKRETPDPIAIAGVAVFKCNSMTRVK